MTVTEVAHQSFYVRRTCFPVTPVSLVKADIAPFLRDAYKGIQTALIARGVKVMAWKLGGTNLVTQQTFSVKDPYFGAIAAQQLFEGQIPVAASARLIQVQAEPELVLRLAADMNASPSEPLQDDLFDRWCWGFEFPSSPIPNIPELGVCALVADQCAAGLLVLGAAQPMDTLPLQAEVLVYDGDDVASAGSLAALTDPPIQQAERFVEIATEVGFSLKAGQWIATGGLAPCVAFKPRTPIRLSIDGEIVLDISVPEKVVING